MTRSWVPGHFPGIEGPTLAAQEPPSRQAAVWRRAQPRAAGASCSAGKARQLFQMATLLGIRSGDK